jgi:hypothetical protein
MKLMEENTIGTLFFEISNYIESDGGDTEDRENEPTENIKAVIQDCLDPKPELSNFSTASIQQAMRCVRWQEHQRSDLGAWSTLLLGCREIIGCLDLDSWICIFERALLSVLFELNSCLI